jgi:hypothetical protein
MKQKNKINKNPILKLDFYDLDVTAFFLTANYNAFVEEIMEFDYSKKDAKKMADNIIDNISLQCIRSV